MQSDFVEAQNFENRDVTPDLKIEPWRQFLEVRHHRIRSCDPAGNSHARPARLGPR